MATQIITRSRQDRNYELLNKLLGYNEEPINYVDLFSFLLFIVLIFAIPHALKRILGSITNTVPREYVVKYDKETRIQAAKTKLSQKDDDKIPMIIADCVKEGEVGEMDSTRDGGHSLINTNADQEEEATEVEIYKRIIDEKRNKLSEADSMSNQDSHDMQNDNENLNHLKTPTATPTEHEQTADGVVQNKYVTPPTTLNRYNPFVSPPPLNRKMASPKRQVQQCNAQIDLFLSSQDELSDSLYCSEIMDYESSCQSDNDFKCNMN